MDEQNSLLDLSRWPIVYITANRAITDDEMIRSILTYTDLLKQRLEPHVVCMSIANAASLALSQRKIIGEIWSSGPGNATPGCLGTAMVFESKLISGMLSAVLWISKPKYPIRSFNDLSEAEAWSRELFAEMPEYDPKNPAHRETLRAMATAGARFSFKHKLISVAELQSAMRQAAERWPEP